MLENLLPTTGQIEESKCFGVEKGYSANDKDFSGTVQSAERSLELVVDQNILLRDCIPASVSIIMPRLVSFRNLETHQIPQSIRRFHLILEVFVNPPQDLQFDLLRRHRQFHLFPVKRKPRHNQRFPR